MTAAAIIALILQGGPLVLDFFLKIRSITTLGPDEHANIVKAVLESNAADEETKARAAAWLASHGALVGASSRFSVKVK